MAASLWRLGGLSWKELARRVWAETNKDDIFGRAAQLSYYFLLALFPLLLFGGRIADLIAAHFMFGSFFKTAWTILQWPLVLLFVLLAFALIYYVAPDLKERRRWEWVSPGATLAVLLWLLVSFAFRLYLHYFNS